MSKPKSTFGVMTEDQKNVVFKNFGAVVVDDSPDNPNHPANPASPNYPRAEGRIPGFPNPLLGDDGVGRIGRWSVLKMDALETILDLIIESYLKDKSWYNTVRCNEALWNMYRRVEWWVSQQADPQKGDFQRALQMIRDCINKILENTNDDPDLPSCPAPYLHQFSGDYFNHFNGNNNITPVVMLDTQELTFDKFKDMIHWVSTVEDQEWEFVRSLGADEISGIENIAKLSLNRLLVTNSTKAFINWRIRNRGYISFKYYVDSDAGNGLLFFINSQQVGGEWGKTNGWVEVKYNLVEGQTYKFEWAVRKRSDRRIGKNAIYIKDIKVVEEIRPLDLPGLPPDFSKGEYPDYTGDWRLYTSQSIVKGSIQGGTDMSKEWKINLYSEGNGQFSFYSRLGFDDPDIPPEIDHFFEDDFTNYGLTATAEHNTYAFENLMLTGDFVKDGTKAYTTKDQATAVYEVWVAEGCKVDLRFDTAVLPSAKVIDHYEQAPGEGFYQFETYGELRWQKYPTELRIEELFKGDGTAGSNFTLNVPGWVEFNLHQTLRPTEALYIWVDARLAFVARGEINQTFHYDLPAGEHSLFFQVIDRETEKEIKENYIRWFTYGGGKGVTYRNDTQLGSWFTIRRDWELEGNRAWTGTHNAEMFYEVSLIPGARFHVGEWLYFHKGDRPNHDHLPTDPNDPPYDPPPYDPQAPNYHPPKSGYGGGGGSGGGGLDDGGWEYNPKDPNDPTTGTVNDEAFELIYHEPFHVQEDNHDVEANQPLTSHSPLWEISLRHMPDGSGNFMRKADEPHSLNTMEIKPLHLDTNGFVVFKYDCDIHRREQVQLYDNGKLVWRSSKPAEDEFEGRDIFVPLRAGDHELKWVYKNLSGTWYPNNPDPDVPPEEGDPTKPPVPEDPTGEQCFIGGQSRWVIDYEQYARTCQTAADRGFEICSDLYNGAYTLCDGYGCTHAGAGDGAWIVRDFTVPEGETVTFQERLRVRAGQLENEPRDGWLYLDWDYDNVWYGGASKAGGDQGGFALTPADNSQPPVIAKYWMGGRVEMYWDQTMVCRTAGYSGARMAVGFYIIPCDEATFDQVRQLKLNDTRFSTYRKKYFTSNQTAQRVTYSFTAPQDGREYWFVWAVADLYSDNDAGQYYTNWNFHCYAEKAIRGANLDDTFVAVKLVNLEKNSERLIGRYFGRIDADGNKTEGHADHYLNIKIPEGHYRVEYVLWMGEADPEDPSKWGMFTLSGGEAVEIWDAYCTDKRGRRYRPGESPFPRTSPTIDEPEFIDRYSWVWLDEIKVFQLKFNINLQTFALADSNPWANSRVIVKVVDADTGQTLYTKVHYSSGIPVPIGIDFTNSTLFRKNYTVSVKFQDIDGGGEDAVVYYGHANIDQSVYKPEDAWIHITNIHSVRDKPVYMGGADGSTMTVNIFDENGGLYSAGSTSGSRRISFADIPYVDAMGVNDLPNTPYTKYRIEITTEQKGVVSPVTGKEYLSTFEIRSVEMVENYNYVPNSFDSALDFYVDGVKVFTKNSQSWQTVAYPVSKGNHEYKWVLRGNNTARNWDFAEIDWIKLTNWVWDEVIVTPHCDAGLGDKCVEELIKCILNIIKNRPKATVIGKKIWLFT